MADRDVIVTGRAALTPSITRFELGPAPGQPPLPAVDPGAHLSVATPAGHRRSYSITELTADGSYAISVLRLADGRGGSKSMHDDVGVGDLLRVDGPRNAFPLVEADEYLLIAGGIGITAIRAMFHALDRREARVQLLYLSRTAEETAYLDELSGVGSHVQVHHSGRKGRIDLWPYLAQPRDGLHLYCCAAQPVMEEVRSLSMHWRPSSVHFEDFTGITPGQVGDQPFRAVWTPTGRTVEVAADSPLLDALNAAGAEVASSCRSGTCGTCVLQLIEGEAEHRDLVLDPAERRSRIIACVSRAAGATLAVGPVRAGGAPAVAEAQPSAVHPEHSRGALSLSIGTLLLGEGQVGNVVAGSDPRVEVVDDHENVPDRMKGFADDGGRGNGGVQGEAAAQRRRRTG